MIALLFLLAAYANEWEELIMSKGLTTHVVKKGETLPGIARKYLGNESYWKKLLEINRQNIKNPIHLKVGLRIAFLGTAPKEHIITADDASDKPPKRPLEWKELPKQSWERFNSIQNVSIDLLGFGSSNKTNKVRT